MDTTGEASVLFQIRWLPQDKDTPAKPANPEESRPSIDIVGSRSQEWDVESTFGGAKESAKSDDVYLYQRGARSESSQQMILEPTYAPPDPELFRSLLGLLENESSSHFTGTHTSDDPWNPLAGRRKSRAGPPARITYTKFWYTGSKLGTSSIYHTARSDFVTNEIFYSAASGSGKRVRSIRGTLSEKTEYLDMLKSKRLWPVDPQMEQNWSGRGQHVEFKNSEIRRINDLLTLQDALGSGACGFVDKVQCGRISLARKTIRTNKRFTKDRAIEEVVHMTRLKHSHVIRLIGTYLWKNDLCILMYPAADNNLESFLEELGKPSPDENRRTAIASSCLGFFSCLSSAVRYIHVSLTKHMDIKPQNVLVWTRLHYRGGGHSEYSSKVYISDFGIARQYQSIEAVNTDGATEFTPKYAAPEVVRRLERDLSADVFSLGCVFLEIFATLDRFEAIQPPNSRFRELREPQKTRSPQSLYDMQEELREVFYSNQDLDKSYQGNLGPLQKLLEARIPQYKGTGAISSSTLRTILRMIQFVPGERPTADDLVEGFGEKACCTGGPEKLEAEDGGWADNAGHDLNLMMTESFLQQNREASSEQQKVRSAALMAHPDLVSLTECHHSWRNCGAWT